MIKTAAPESTPAGGKSEKNQAEQIASARSQFIAASLTMSWQLAIAVLVPVIGGYEIDKHFNSAPVFTILGFIIAMAGATLITKAAFDKFNVSTGDKK